MKTFIFFIASTFAFSASLCFAHSPSLTKADYDPGLVLLAKQKIVPMMRLSKDASILVQLIERSRTFKYGDVAFDTLNSMRQQYPENTNVQAAFCWAYLRHIDTAYIKGGDYRNRTENEQKIFESALSQARKSSSSHWLLSLVDGYRNYASGIENWQVAFSHDDLCFVEPLWLRLVSSFEILGENLSLKTG